MTIRRPHSRNSQTANETRPACDGRCYISERRSTPTDNDETQELHGTSALQRDKALLLQSQKSHAMHTYMHSRHALERSVAALAAHFCSLASHQRDDRLESLLSQFAEDSARLQTTSDTLSAYEAQSAQNDFGILKADMAILRTCRRRPSTCILDKDDDDDEDNAITLVRSRSIPNIVLAYFESVAESNLLQDDLYDLENRLLEQVELERTIIDRRHSFTSRLEDAQCRAEQQLQECLESGLNPEDFRWRQMDT